MIRKVELMVAEGTVVPGDIFVDSKDNMTYKILDILQVSVSSAGVRLVILVSPFFYASYEMIEYFRNKNEIEIIVWLE